MINLEKEIREQPIVMASLLEKNKDTLKALVEELEYKNINNIYFAARGTSDHACVYAQYLFGIVMGIPCTLGTPSIFTQYGTDIKFNNSLVIGVSQSGRAEDVNYVLESAKKQGMPTLAITNYEDSLLAKTAKYHLFCNAGEEKSIAATKTFTAQMYLLALLCAKWSQNNELANALNAIPVQFEEALDYLPLQIENIVPSLLNYDGAVVLGRGISYSIALEGALKILETNKMKVKGYPISDFYHGPVAQLHDNDLAFVLGQSGLMLEDAKKMIAKLDNVGAKTIVITDDPKICGKNTLVTIKNTGCEYTMAFILALAMQMFALKLVIAKGIDPDKSNVIAKITITK
ncbi:MAG: SIS domain-containing protein [Clostridia bacterium]|nr:SIS domain-containing protein [Clostridia bacterium]